MVLQDQLHTAISQYTEVSAGVRIVLVLSKCSEFDEFCTAGFQYVHVSSILLRICFPIHRGFVFLVVIS